MRKLELKKISKLLFLVVLLSLGLRIYGLSYHDSYTDEVLYSFRAIEMIDYDTSPTQTTPWQWFNDVPWWAHLSFHDHPILFFLTEHLSMKLFGINLFAVRLPSVLFGVGAVILIFLLAKKIFNERVALLAALLLGVNSYHLWVSRLGLQDGMIIFLLLLIIWLWLKAIEDARYWFWCGIVIGLGILTKYTILIIFPILFLHALLFKIRVYKEKYFWAGLLAILIVSSPVWLYNIFLYKTRGHFDFQISAALNQYVPEWSFRLGRLQAGSLEDRFNNFFVSITSAQSIWFNVACLLSFAYLAVVYLRTKEKKILFLAGTIWLFFLWFLVTGSALRFVVMVVPFLVLLVSLFFERLYINSNRIFIGLLALIFVFLELLFSFNSFMLPQSWGIKNVAYAGANVEMQNFGFNQLDVYLDELLNNKYTYFLGTPEYNFLNQFPDDYIAKMKLAGSDSLPIIIVFDKNLNFLSSLWVFDRRLYYQGWLIIDEVVFENVTGEELDQYYRKMGMKKFVYISAASEGVCFQNSEPREQTKLKKLVKQLKIIPEEITNEAGQPAFLVYEF